MAADGFGGKVNDSLISKVKLKIPFRDSSLKIHFDPVSTRWKADDECRASSADWPTARKFAASRRRWPGIPVLTSARI